IVGPRAAAAAAAVVVVTNSRRSMLLRLVIAMPSKGLKGAVSGVGCRVSGPYPLTPEPRYLSQRIQHAEGDLIGARRAGVVPRHRPEVFQADRVAARAEAQ